MKTLEETGSRWLMKQTIHDIDARMKKRVTAQSTGFTCLDKELNGLQNGDLVLLVSEQGDLADALIVNMLSGGFAQQRNDDKPRPRLLCTASEPVQILMSMLACMADMPLYMLQQGRLEQPVCSALGKAMQSLNQYPLYIDDSIQTLEQLSARIVQIASATGQTPLVMVDGRAPSDTLRSSCVDWQALADKYQLPVLVALSDEQQAETLVQAKAVIHLSALVDPEQEKLQLQLQTSASEETKQYTLVYCAPTGKLSEQVI